MAENSKWNKKVFSILLERAKGVRSWRQFASECDVSYVQMRKLASMSQENPPRPKLIRKVADKAFNDVDLEDLLFAAGMSSSGRPLPHKQQEPSQGDPFLENLRALPARDRRLVEEYVSFLAQRRRTEAESSEQEQ